MRPISAQIDSGFVCSNRRNGARRSAKVRQGAPWCATEVEPSQSQLRRLVETILSKWEVLGRNGKRQLRLFFGCQRAESASHANAKMMRLLKNGRAARQSAL